MSNRSSRLRRSLPRCRLGPPGPGLGPPTVAPGPREVSSSGSLGCSRATATSHWSEVRRYHPTPDGPCAVGPTRFAPLVQRKVPVARPSLGARERELVEEVLASGVLALGPFADRF